LQPRFTKLGFASQNLGNALWSLFFISMQALDCFPKVLQSIALGYEQSLLRDTLIPYVKRGQSIAYAQPLSLAC